MIAEKRKGQIKTHLRTILNDFIKAKSANEKRKAEDELRKYIESYRHEPTGTSFLDDLNVQLKSLVDDFGIPSDKLASIINFLIDITENEPRKISIFSNYLRNALSNYKPSDVATLTEITSALGRLAKASTLMKTLTAEWVHFECKRALEWLESKDRRIYASILVLKELAENSPTFFFSHVERFLKLIWIGLRDSGEHIRQASILALKNVLVLVADRHCPDRNWWYHDLIKEVEIGFKKRNPEHIHASLLVTGELLEHTGKAFMRNHFDKICKSFLKFSQHRNPLVRKTVIQLSPILSKFYGGPFEKKYLSHFVKMVLKVFKNPVNRDAAYLSLGELCIVCEEGSMREYVTEIMEQITEGFIPKRNRPFVEEALRCLSMVSNRMPDLVKEEVFRMLQSDLLYGNGLSQELFDCLDSLVKTYPMMLKMVQLKLLDVVSVILSRTPYTHMNLEKFQIHPVLDSKGDYKTISLALSTLGNFDMRGHNLTDFVADCVIQYLEHEDAKIRKEAAKTCCSLLLLEEEQTNGTFGRIFSTKSKSKKRQKQNFGKKKKKSEEEEEEEEEEISGRRSIRRRGSSESSTKSKKQEKQTKKSSFSKYDMERIRDEKDYLGYIVGDVLQKLLVVAISDPDPNIRLTVLEHLDPQFDKYLALSDHLGLLFISLHDEYFKIREISIKIIGRLSEKNPAYVLSSLRRILLQLLTKLDFSEDSRSKEESAQMLGHLIMASPRLISPYAPNIYAVLKKNVLNPSVIVSSRVLESIGKLSKVSGSEMIKFFDELLLLIIKTLQDQSSSQKREIAVKTLGHLVRSTGHVILPYKKHPQLLSILLNILKGEETWSARREVIKVLGIIGAIDPHFHKLLEQGSTGDEIETGEMSKRTDDDILIDFPPSSNEYGPTVAFISLMKILKDPTLKIYHTDVITAVMFIFRSLGIRCVPYLEQIMKPFFNLIHQTKNVDMKISLFQQLCVLIRIVRHHIRDYLDEIFILIRKNWNLPSQQKIKIHIIALEEQLCLSLNDEFTKYLPEVVPPIILVIKTSENENLVIKGLQSICVFAKYLSNYLYLVIPCVVSLFEKPDSSPRIIECAVWTIDQICLFLDIFEYSSRILHPLVRLLRRNDPEIARLVLLTLCVLITQLKQRFLIFVPLINQYLGEMKILNEIKNSVLEYERLVDELKKRKHVSLSDLLDTGFSSGNNKIFHTFLGNKGPPFPIITKLSDESVVSTELKKFQPNVNNLRKAWEATHRSAKEDWVEWCRGLSVELLAESPSPALRSCSSLAQFYHPLSKELFNAGFISCWCELDQKAQGEIVRAIELAFSSPELPSEVLQMLLNVAEFMEHDEKALPIAISSLGYFAEKCQCFAKSLHYKEREFRKKPSNHIDALISINNKLQQHEAAIGILRYAQKHKEIEFKDFWYEKLERWKDALDSYRLKLEGDKNNIELMIGIMRCLQALGEWEQLGQLTSQSWGHSDEFRGKLAPMACNSAWILSNWEFMDESVSYLQDDDQGCFYNAVLCVHRNEFEEAQRYIDRARELLDTEIGPLVGESYLRAYDRIVELQELVELEEVIEYQLDEKSRLSIRKIWKDRLTGLSDSIQHWRRILSIRQLVLTPDQLQDDYIKLAELSREGKNLSLSSRIFTSLLIRNFDPEKNPHFLLSQSKEIGITHKVSYHFLQHLWDCGGKKRTDAVSLLDQFVGAPKMNRKLRAQAYVTLGKWNQELFNDQDPMFSGVEPMDVYRLILNHFKRARDLRPNWHLSWHYYAVFHSQVASYLDTLKKRIKGEISPLETTNQKEFDQKRILSSEASNWNNIFNEKSPEKKIKELVEKNKNVEDAKLKKSNEKEFKLTFGDPNEEKNKKKKEEKEQQQKKVEVEEEEESEGESDDDDDNEGEGEDEDEDDSSDENNKVELRGVMEGFKIKKRTSFGIPKHLSASSINGQREIVKDDGFKLELIDDNEAKILKKEEDEKRNEFYETDEDEDEEEEIIEVKSQEVNSNNSSGNGIVEQTVPKDGDESPATELLVLPTRNTPPIITLQGPTPNERDDGGLRETSKRSERSRKWEIPTNDVDNNQKENNNNNNSKVEEDDENEDTEDSEYYSDGSGEDEDENVDDEEEEEGEEGRTQVEGEEEGESEFESEGESGMDFEEEEEEEEEEGEDGEGGNEEDSEEEESEDESNDDEDEEDNNNNDFDEKDIRNKNQFNFDKNKLRIGTGTGNNNNNNRLPNHQYHPQHQHHQHQQHYHPHQSREPFDFDFSSAPKEWTVQQVTEEEQTSEIEHHLSQAISGFFKSISLSPALNTKNAIQDILRLLTLWFRHGDLKAVNRELIRGFRSISVDTWLNVIPQIIARINADEKNVKSLVSRLLFSIGKRHPQALVYPLTVCSKSENASRKHEGHKLLHKLREHHPRLIDQALLVSKELIRVAILWPERWHVTLEDASRLYFGQKNVEGMFKILVPLHTMIQQPETLSEVAFQQTFGKDLNDAYTYLQKYQQYQHSSSSSNSHFYQQHHQNYGGGQRGRGDGQGGAHFISSAWELYYSVFRRIAKQLEHMVKLEMRYISPKLHSARKMELAVPGTYLAKNFASKPHLIGLFNENYNSIDYFRSDSSRSNLDEMYDENDEDSNNNGLYDRRRSSGTTNNPGSNMYVRGRSTPEPARVFRRRKSSNLKNYHLRAADSQMKKRFLRKSSNNNNNSSSGNQNEDIATPSTPPTHGISWGGRVNNLNDYSWMVDGLNDLGGESGNTFERKQIFFVERIGKFIERLDLISSKQRPRKLIIQGDNNNNNNNNNNNSSSMGGGDVVKNYQFLLKGHEDLRQDERVMQLFGLVNTLLHNNPKTRKKYLNIKRYSVIPLSSNAGLLGWVGNCDPLHALIKEYRESRNILLNIEHRFMMQMAPFYDNLTLQQKIEVFEYALSSTTGQDLHKVLWYKSSSCEIWLDKRTNYTRSLAVMSMVGYILGLGDRHPSNLMLEKHSGKIVHIDFGDCFEVAMNRDKFPEKIPFRLTRMLVNAMEVCGIEGTFRSTCESVMRVLRRNKNSVMVMLEAFVYDPLINWRLIETKFRKRQQNDKNNFFNNSNNTNENNENTNTNTNESSNFFESKESSNNTNNNNKENGENNNINIENNNNNNNDSNTKNVNKKALSVIKRIENKLDGKEFNFNKINKGLEIKDQVQNLIEQATSNANLCQCYIGWCAFW